MSELIIGIYDHKSGETIVRAMNEEEIENWEKSKSQSEARKQAENERVAKRISAADKLRALGLEEEEVEALLS